MACKRCQHISSDGDQCKRKASCHVDCYDFCWQHAEKWSQTKGCTGKKLYQYRKKPGPKTGKCGPTEMIGVSRKCVKRTPANLKAKKKALAKRKIAGKATNAKEPEVSSDDEPFIEIPEESPEEVAVSSDDESPFIEVPGTPDVSFDMRDLRECRDNVVELREGYIKEKKDKETVVKFFDALSKDHLELREQRERELQDLRQECANQKQDLAQNNEHLQSAYNFQLAQASAKERDLISCKYDLGQLTLQYDSKKEASEREIGETDQAYHRERALVEQYSERVQIYQDKLIKAETEYKNQLESYRETISDLRQRLQEYQREISENEREINSLKSDYKRLEERLLQQGIDEGNLGLAREEYDLLIAEKEEELKLAKTEFAKLYQEYYDLQESGRSELGEIRSKMVEQRNALVQQENEMKECERGLEELSRQSEEQLQVSRKELEGVKSEILLQQGKLQEIEGDLTICQIRSGEQQEQFEEQQASGKKEFEELKEQYEIQRVEASKKDYGVEGLEKEIGKLQDQLSSLQSTRERDREEYRDALSNVQDYYAKEVQSTAEDERGIANREIEEQKGMAKLIEQDCNLEIREHKEQLVNFQQLYDDIEGLYENMISNLTQQLRVAQQKVVELTGQEGEKSARVVALENELGGLKQQNKDARDRGKKRFLEIRAKQKRDKEQFDLERANDKEEERRKEEEWEHAREVERTRHEERIRYLTDFDDQETAAAELQRTESKIRGDSHERERESVLL